MNLVRNVVTSRRWFSIRADGNQGSNGVERVEPKRERGEILHCRIRRGGRARHRNPAVPVRGHARNSGARQVCQFHIQAKMRRQPETSARTSHDERAVAEPADPEALYRRSRTATPNSPAAPYAKSRPPR